MTPATVIAILTILGYSLYDTVVVFDKMQENVKERGDRHTYGAIVNMSMNQVLMRSINTSLVIAAADRQPAVRGVVPARAPRRCASSPWPCSSGVATGIYSSIFLAAPLVGMWKEREDHWIKVRKRLERRGAAEELRSARDGGPHRRGDRRSHGAVPRPPRKRQKGRR